MTGQSTTFDNNSFPNVISRSKGEAGYWRGSTVRTIGAIGRRIGPASPATVGGAPHIRRICIALGVRNPRRARLAPCRETSNVCVMGQQIARLEEDHI